MQWLEICVCHDTNLCKLSQAIKGCHNSAMLRVGNELATEPEHAHHAILNRTIVCTQTLRDLPVDARVIVQADEAALTEHKMAGATPHAMRDCVGEVFLVRGVASLSWIFAFTWTKGDVDQGRACFVLGDCFGTLHRDAFMVWSACLGVVGHTARCMPQHMSTALPARYGALRI